MIDLNDLEIDINVDNESKDSDAEKTAIIKELITNIIESKGNDYFIFCTAFIYAQKIGLMISKEVEEYAYYIDRNVFGKKHLESSLKYSLEKKPSKEVDFFISDSNIYEDCNNHEVIISLRALYKNNTYNLKLKYYVDDIYEPLHVGFAIIFE